MTYSVPSTEHPQSSSACNERHAGADAARQPEHVAVKRLARGSNVATGAGIISMFVAVIGLTINLNSVGTVVIGSFIILSIALLNLTLADYRDCLEGSESLCRSLQAANYQIENQNLDLQQDVEHWKALSFTKRGGLSVVKDGTAAGISCSDKQEAPAAVVPFPTDGDAA